MVIHADAHAYGIGNASDNAMRKIRPILPRDYKVTREIDRNKRATAVWFKKPKVRRIAIDRRPGRAEKIKRSITLAKHA
jgi:hypothetical protein